MTSSWCWSVWRRNKEKDLGWLLLGGMQDITLGLKRKRFGAEFSSKEGRLTYGEDEGGKECEPLSLWRLRCRCCCSHC